MICYSKGNIFDFFDSCDAVVNPVNTHGVMGAGLAKAFKIRFPEMFEEYQTLCKYKDLQIGKIHTWYKSEPHILNFPTKDHWKNPSQISYIEKGLTVLANMKYNTIVIPALGCGLGGLKYDEVKSLYEKYLVDKDTNYICLAP